jgi:cell division protein FtsI/penicillin-binding protein 2
MAVAFGALAAGAGYWQVWRSADLSSAPDDAAVVAASRRVVRGEITDRDGGRLAWSAEDENGEPYRVYSSRSFSGVLGYASRAYGTAGLERSYDAELSGVTSADPVQQLLRKFRADPSDPQAMQATLATSLQEAAIAALGGDSGARSSSSPRRRPTTPRRSPTRRPRRRPSRRSRPTTWGGRSCPGRRRGGTCRARCSRS